MARQTWLLGDSRSADDKHLRKAITFGQPSSHHGRVEISTHPPHVDPIGVKGDQQWLAEVAPKLVTCSCSQCNAGFQADADFYSSSRCPRCRTPSEQAAVEPSAADLHWRSTLHTDKPRLVPKPGKVAERPRCALCGMIGPHVCFARGQTPEFDSPADRARVGFKDRGKLRYLPTFKSSFHAGGWTSGGTWPMLNKQRAHSSPGVQHVQIAAGSEPHTTDSWAAPRGPTPFSSPPHSAVQSPGSSVRSSRQDRGGRASAVTSARPTPEAAQFQPPQVLQQGGQRSGDCSARTRRWEERRAAFLAARAQAPR